MYVRPSDTHGWLEALVIHDNGYVGLVWKSDSGL